MRQEVSTPSVKEMSGFLDKLKPQIELAVPKHMSADRMARLALTAFSTNQKLQECSTKSIAASIMTAGQLGLEPGVNGAGYLVPYKGTCTFVPGWRGLVDLVSRSGRGTVYTGVIYKDQDYTYKDGATRDLVVHNESDMLSPIDITHAFAIGRVKGSEIPIIELWSVKKITVHRDKYNKVGKSHYSFDNWEMYCRKIPLMQVLKYMPASIELGNALDVSNAAESGHGVVIEDGVVIDIDDDPKGQEDFQKSKPATEAKKDFFPNDEFEKNLPKWRELIANNKKTADQIIAMANSKAPLTENQKAEIKAPIENIEEDVSFDQVRKKLEMAKDVDGLDLAADLIAEVSDSDQRKVLMETYKNIKEKMAGK